MHTFKVAWWSCIVILFSACGKDDPMANNDASVALDSSTATDASDGGDGFPSCTQVASASNLVFQSTMVTADCGTGDICYQTALASSGNHLYLYDFENAQLFRSTSGTSGWTDLGVVTGGQPMATEHSDVTSSVVYAPSIGTGGGLMAIHQASGGAQRQFAVYDIATGDWTQRTQALFMTHGLVALGDYIFGYWHAGLSAPLRRYLIAGGQSEQGSTLGNIEGSNPTWFSRAGQMAGLDGALYGTKNDETTDPAGTGDRLFKIDHSSFANGAETPTTDLAKWPFELGQGSVMVGLPAGWNDRVSSEGALLVTAGRSPSDGNGQGSDASDAYAIYDIACDSIQTGTLPAASGRGASATMHGDTLFIKRGGDPDAPANQTLWYTQ